MDKSVASKISGFMKEYENMAGGKYSLQDILHGGKELAGFHQWADGKDNLGSYRIEIDNENYYFMLIDWRNDFSNYYIVVYPEERNRPIVEMHNVQVGRSRSEVTWRYKPCKRDGLNEQRKAAFRKSMVDEFVSSCLPNHMNELEDFLDDILKVVRCREAADNFVSISC